MTAAAEARKGARRGAPKGRGLTRLLIPITALAVVLGVYPIVRGVYTGFTNERVGGVFGAATTKFTGLQNYQTLWSDKAFVSGLEVVLLLGLTVVGATYVLAYLQAVVLNQSFPGRRVVRAISMLPLAVAPVVVGQMYGYLYDPSVGAVNGLLLGLGLKDAAEFLPTSEMGIFWLAIPSIWLALPFATIFLLASMQGVSRELIEAATIDGAGPIRCFFTVVFPQTLGALAAILPLSFAGQVASFDVYFTLLGGITGAANANLLVPSIYGYYALTTGLVGRAAAVVNVILVVVMVAFVVSRFIDARQRRD